MAKDKIAKAFLAITKDKFTIDTIAEMIATKHLAEGDIVRLNGYYSAGDGANHIRKISKTDDGSGVQLANGLWANIVHSGEVNVSWFGAKKTNIDNDFIISKALNFLRISCSKLNFDIGEIQIKSINIENLDTKCIDFKSTIFTCVSDVVVDYAIKVKGFKSSLIQGQCFVNCQSSKNYKAGVVFESENVGHNVIANSSFYNIKVVNCVLAFRIGVKDSKDLISENSFFGLSCNNCCSAIEYNGHESVNSFINCNFVSGELILENITTYDCITLNGGVFRLVGGELVSFQGGGAGNNSTIRINASLDSTDVKSYGQFYATNTHIETYIPLLFVSESLDSISEFSVVNFDNCGGFVGVQTSSNFIEIREQSFIGFLRLKKCNFYSGVDRVAVNVYCNNKKTKLDIDTDNFNKGFVQGILGISGGSLKGELISSFRLTTAKGNVSVGELSLISEIVYNPNFSENLSLGKIIAPFNSKKIFLSGFSISNGDISIRVNGVDRHFLNGSFGSMLEVKENDVISIYNHSATTVTNLIVEVYFSVDFSKFQPNKLEIQNPILLKKMEGIGILDSYHNYLTELHEYEKSQNVPEGVMNLNVVQPPVIPKEVEEYAKEYNLL